MAEPSQTCLDFVGYQQDLMFLCNSPQTLEKPGWWYDNPPRADGGLDQHSRNVCCMLGDCLEDLANAFLGGHTARGERMVGGGAVATIGQAPA